MITPNTEVAFVYSEIQERELNEIAKKTSKRFILGELYDGTTIKYYSKRIAATDVQAMTRQYPDTIVLAKGKQINFKFKDPKTALNI